MVSNGGERIGGASHTDGGPSRIFVYPPANALPAQVGAAGMILAIAPFEHTD